MPFKKALQLDQGAVYSANIRLNFLIKSDSDRHAKIAVTQLQNARGDAGVLL